MILLQGFCPFDESPHPHLENRGHRDFLTMQALRCLRRQDAQSRRLYPTRSKTALPSLRKPRSISAIPITISMCLLCFDSEPGKNSRFWSGASRSMTTISSASSGYFSDAKRPLFYVNPLGVQQDGHLERFSGAGLFLRHALEFTRQDHFSGLCGVVEFVPFLRFPRIRSRPGHLL